MTLSEKTQPTDNGLNYKTNYLLPITNRPELCFIRGKGDYLYDQTGKQYLDLIQGWAVNTLGHSPKIMQQTLFEQSQMLINPGPAFYNKPMLNLAENLCQHSVFDQVFFANSGAEANEGAIKLARKWGQLNKDGANKIITFDQGFHGRTLATMSATGKERFNRLYEPKVPGFTKVPFNDLEAAKAAIDKHTVAIMLEPVQGEAGVIPAMPEFMSNLRELCDQHNLLLIMDEVQTGIGRTGKLFCYEHYGVCPDIMTLGKGLGGGFPISALLTHKKFSCFEPGDQGGTFNGNPLACSVANAVFTEVSSTAFLESSQSNASYLKKKLEGLVRKFNLLGVRGKGMLLALNTANLYAPEIVQRALKEGLLLNAPRPDTLRFMPALNIQKEAINEGIGILERILEETI
ncbi:MAG: acetylornithine transaminase [Neptuniibacter sp.]